MKEISKIFKVSKRLAKKMLLNNNKLACNKEEDVDYNEEILEVKIKKELHDSERRDFIANINRTHDFKLIEQRININKSKHKIIWYVAAASIVILFAISSIVYYQGHYYKDTTRNIAKEYPNAGSNKAVLTLENGKTISLAEKSLDISENLNYKNKKLTYLRKNNKIKFKEEYNYLTIPRGGQFQLQLSDSTKVWINSETKLKYPTAFLHNKARKVEILYGEVYFEVTSSLDNNGNSFIVVTPNQTIEVLGTKFNVRLYKDEKEIATTLIEGKVSIETDKVKKILNPSEQFRYNTLNNEYEIKLVDASAITTWKEGYFNFNNLSLYEVMQSLSRWYDIDIVILDKHLGNSKFRGSISKNQNIKNILNILQISNELEYEIQENKIEIKAKRD